MTAQARLDRAIERQGQSPYAHFHGEWCLQVGVRIHYRGRLLRVEHWGGKLVGLWHPLYEVDSIYDEDEKAYGKPTGGGPRYTTPDAPAVVPIDGCLDLTLQPPDWPQQ